MKYTYIKNLSVKNSLFFIITFILSPYAYSEVTLDGSMGTAGSVSGPDYQITEELGQRAGNNLFHSFGQFNISSTESATFSGSAGINNVISRVTGGQTSTIDGAFRSTIPGANVYFLNPSGVIFGENASLDVQGSFHASTADYLKFKDGVKFETGVANANPLLTVASPEAFGFLDASPAPITVSGGLNKVLKVPEGETLSLVAGDISINDRSLYAPSGQVVLASAGSIGEVVFNASGIDTSSFSQGGKIHLSRLAANPVPIINDSTQIADIDVSADAAGKVVIRGGQMVMDNAYIWADTTDKEGRDINIGLAGDLTINGVAEIAGVDKTPQSGITAYTQGKGNAGNIILNVDDLKLTHGTRIDSSITTSSSGDGGNLIINAYSILLEGNDSKSVPNLITTTKGTGNAGNITINNTDKVQVNKGAFISTLTFDKGNTGTISINTGSLELHDNSKIYSTVTKKAMGNSADLTINASHSVIIDNDAVISNTTNGKGNAGNLIINSNALKVKNGNILVHTNNTGNAGNLAIITGSLDLLGGTIGSDSSSVATGQNGKIDIEANTILLEGKSFSNRTEISGSVSGKQDTGNLTVTADKLEIKDWAAIIINNFGTGNTGNLLVKANEILITNEVGGSNGIFANNYATGNSGNLTVESNNLIIRHGGRIGVSNEGSGHSGALSINVNEDIILDGVSTLINPENGNPMVTIRSGISNAASSSGQVKNTFISAKNILVKDNAVMFTTTTASSDAGNMIIKADHFDIQGAGIVTTGSVSLKGALDATGNGGNIVIIVKHLDINDSFITSSSLGTGNAGDITIHARNIGMNNAGILTATDGPGKAGNLTIDTANNIALNNSTLVSSSTFVDFNSITAPETAKSGDITVTARGIIRLENNSAISSDTRKSHAGTIKINGKASLQLQDESKVLSLVADGQGQGGDIFIDNPIVALDNSFINANAVKGAGGNITVSGILFQSPQSFVTASSEKNVDGQLNAKPETNMSGNLAVLPASLLNASEHLSNRCITRSEENKNSFVIKSRGGIPLSPGELSPANSLDYLPSENTPFFSKKNKNTHSKTSLRSNNLLPYNKTPCIQ